MSPGEGWSPRTAAAHTFADSLEAPVLDSPERHHLQRVRRLREGEVITVGDGRGRWRAVRLGPVLEPELEPCGPIESEPAPQPAITVAFAPAKGDRPEWVVQKLTELGVDRIVPLRTERGVVRWEGERAERQVVRLRRVAWEAAAQSRRIWLPDVTEPVAFEDALHWDGVSLADCVGPGLPPPSLARPTVLIGPEGGWSAQERMAAADLGVGLVGVGPNVLRAETAAIAAGVLLVAARSARDLG